MAEAPTDENSGKAAWERLQSLLDPTVRQKQDQVFAKAPAVPAWYLIVQPDLEPEPQVLSFDTYDELVAAVKQLKPADWAMPIYGWPVRYSVPDEQTGLKFLIHPSGYTTPLFTIPTEVRVSSSFFLQGSAPLEGDEDEPDRDRSDDSELEELPATPAQRDAARSATAAIVTGAPEDSTGDESEDFEYDEGAEDDEDDEDAEDQDEESDDDEGVDDDNPDSEDLPEDEHPGL